MNVQVCDVACLFFLLYANLLVLVTLCEGNHYPFIEERYVKKLTYTAKNPIFFDCLLYIWHKNSIFV